MGKWLRRLGLGVVGLLGLLVATVLVAGLLYRDPGRRPTPSGAPRRASIYLTMRDGTRIAADVWLPETLATGARVPVLIKGTPYWRSAGLTFLGKAASVLGAPVERGEPDIPILNQRGFAVIAVDTRGTGASFGHQSIAMDDPEIGDFGEIVDWAARQPWSNGRVGAYGFSYRGMLAVGMASLDHPALRAIAPSFDFTDLYLTTYPGGVFSNTFLRKWGAGTGGLNRGEPPCSGLCRWLISGPRPVDADPDGRLRAAAIAEHALNYDVYRCAKAAPFRDSLICGSGKSFDAVSELSRAAGVEKSGIPIYVTAGYFDATSPSEVLRRFKTFSNPQIVVLGPISHGGFMSTDPFAPPAAGVDPPYDRQVADMAAFFDRYLRPGGAPITPLVRYAVLNGGGWRSAVSWPPPGVEATRYYLAADHALSPDAPTGRGEDVYPVDFSASSGDLSRYQSPVDLSRTAYPDRAAQDRKLLTYTTAPLAADTEIAGDPVATLNLASSTTDGVVIVYLEDVRADGSVVYLTEGVLRLADRRLAPPGASLSADPLHSYLARDASPMTAGRPETVVLGLSPIAAVFHRGDRIRIAIAGADTANFQRIPASGPATMTIGRAPGALSYVELAIAHGR